MFEKTKAAASKAHEHLLVAERLAGPRWLPIRRFYGQAFAHLVYALEQASVAEMRFLTESGIVSWEDPPSWFTWTEADLSKPGTHNPLMRLGLTFAACRIALVRGAPLELGSGTEKDPARLVDHLSIVLSKSLESVFSDTVWLDLLRDGTRGRNSAVYSDPWKGKSRPPGRADYENLHAMVRPFLIALNRAIPVGEKNTEYLSTLRPLVPLVVGRIGAERERLSNRLREATAGEWPTRQGKQTSSQAPGR